MFCEKCGNEIKVGARFCGKCGAPVMQGVETPVVTETPVQKEIPAAPGISVQREIPIAPGTPEHEESSSRERKPGFTGIISKILAGISAALLLAGLPLPYITVESRILLLYDYLGINNFRMYYILFVLIFAGIFVFFKVINRWRLAFIGCVGIWVEAAFLLFVTMNVVNGYASIYNAVYVLGLGFYLHMGGVVLQLIAAVMNGSGSIGETQQE